MDEPDAPVYFGPGDLSEVVAAVRRWSSPAEEIIGWVEIEPIDLPAHLLPEVKGFFGRTKPGERPVAQVIYVDPASGAAASTISLVAPGRDVGAELRDAGVTAPHGAEIDGARDTAMVLVDVGDDAESLLRFAVDALAALVPGWEPRFRATPAAL